MGAAVDLLLGSVRVEITCRYAEQAANLCARHHVDFRDLRRNGRGGTELTVGPSGYARLKRLARETGSFQVRALRRRGASFFLWRLRKRYALLAGLVLCAAALGLSTLFVWQIDVTGNETVSSSRILAALREEGVDIGTCVLDIKNKWIANDMLLRIPELSFITLNTYGSRIQVVVREETPKPEMMDPEVPTRVCAGKAGLLTLMEVEEGWVLRGIGETVEAGDELVGAYVPIGTGRLTHARARVWARTWYEMSLRMPLETVRKTYTGAKKTRTAIILGGKRINFYISGGNPYRECDKMTVAETLTLPGGAVLPLTVIRESFEEYESQAGTLTEEEARAILEARLLMRLEELVGEGSVTSTDFEAALEGGILTVTLRAECLEEIAVERPLTPEEIAQAGS